MRNKVFDESFVAFSNLLFLSKSSLFFSIFKNFFKKNVRENVEFSLRKGSRKGLIFSFIHELVNKASVGFSKNFKLFDKSFRFFLFKNKGFIFFLKYWELLLFVDDFFI